MEIQDQIKYEQAKKQVRKIKGFYTHLIVYIMINSAILLAKLGYLSGEKTVGLELRDLNTAFFWGIGLIAHGLSVFLPSMILGKNWEEKKINQLMEKNKNNKWE